MRLVSERDEIRSRKKGIADLLLDFRPAAHVAWQSSAEALQEVEESLGADKRRISIAAIDNDEVVGWIAGLEFFASVVEIHPIVVKASSQKKGVGRFLLSGFEKRAGELGYTVVFAGTDDQNCSTSLGGVELYPDALEKLREIKDLKGNSFGFYQKCGYELIGVLPDANGKGKPDIWLAKTIIDD